MTFKYNMEQAMGVEPTSQAWEARILPMYYACKKRQCLFIFNLFETFYFEIFNKIFFKSSFIKITLNKLT